MGSGSKPCPGAAAAVACGRGIETASLSRKCTGCSREFDMSESNKKNTIDGSHFSPDILDFIRILWQYEVRYLLVGGEAVIYYGHARLTGDVDFFFDDSDANACSLFKALVEFWGGSLPELSGYRELQKPGLIIQFGAPPNRIDLMNRISGVLFSEAWPRRRVVGVTDNENSENLFLSIIGPEDLLVNKKASGRPKDIADVPYLL